MSSKYSRVARNCVARDVLVFCGLAFCLLVTASCSLVGLGGDGQEPDDGQQGDARTPRTRCELNRAEGPVTFVTGYDFAASAGIIDAVVAQSEGYFDELCLDVRIEPGFAPVNSTLVIEGKAEFGTAGSFAELVNVNVVNEGDLVAILHWGRTAIEAIVLPADSEVEDFSDLCGKSVGIKGDLPYSLRAALSLSGEDASGEPLERSCFDNEVILEGFDPVAHLEGGIDALPVYKSNEPNILESQNVPFKMLDPSDYEVPSSFGIVFTTRSFLDENYDFVQDVVRALVRGWQFAVDNPEVAVDHAFSMINVFDSQAGLARETELHRWDVESDLVTRFAREGVGLGIPDVELLSSEIASLAEIGVFAQPPDVRSMVNIEVAEGVYNGTELKWWPSSSS